MDIVKNPKIDWLGKKWIFIAISLILALGGVLSFTLKGGLNMGVDFTGGTLVYVKFKDSPDLPRIRQTLASADLAAEEVTRFDEPSMNEVQIRIARVEEQEEIDNLEQQSERVRQALTEEFEGARGEAEGKFDLNEISQRRLTERLSVLDPEGLADSKTGSGVANRYQGLAARIVDYRTEQGGLIKEFSELENLELGESLRQALQQESYLGSFAILSVESVGPKVGQELRERAQSAIAFSLLGVLTYIAFRFQLIYGFAAIVALFHDVLLTLGFFSLTGKEISLTVVAALLTLVGYSINDTIVVFDRVRENSKLMRRANFAAILNTSINQTLNRTIMTSGMTFLAVLALYLLGGEALNAFSFALVIGIIVGTYSSIAIASPIVLWWQNYRAKRKAQA